MNSTFNASVYGGRMMLDLIVNDCVSSSSGSVTESLQLLYPNLSVESGTRALLQTK